jgi:hypothetical protein
VRWIKGNIIAVLPSSEHVFNVARAAIRLDYDVGSVAVHPSSLEITHPNYEKWNE